MLWFDPHKFVFSSTFGYLAKGPSNMREPQHEPTIEVGKA